MKRQKLDRRHKGFGTFKYALDFSFKEKAKFCEIREWFWETFGPSCELEFWYETRRNASWAWIFDEYRVRIYLTGEKELQWFILKWG